MYINEIDVENLGTIEKANIKFNFNEDYFNDVKEVRDYIKNILLPEFDNLSDEEEIYFKIWY